MQFETPQQYQGKEIEVKFLEMDAERQRLVLSARKVFSEQQFQAYSVSHTLHGTKKVIT